MEGNFDEIIERKVNEIKIKIEENYENLIEILKNKQKEDIKNIKQKYEEDIKNIKQKYEEIKINDVKKYIRNDPSIDSDQNNKSEISIKFSNIRDNEIINIRNSIIEFLNIENENKNKKILTLIFINFLLKNIWKSLDKEEEKIINDINIEKINLYTETLANKINSEIEKNFNKKINQKDEIYSSLYNICKESILLAIELLKATPASFIFTPKLDFDFNSNEHMLTVKQEILIKEVVFPGLKFGSKVFQKAKVLVELN
jgi:hypothetical protein